MKVEIEDNRKFGELDIGDSFKFQTSAYIKTARVSSASNAHQYNALNLQTGQHILFEHDMAIQPRRMKVVNDE